MFLELFKENTKMCQTELRDISTKVLYKVWYWIKIINIVNKTFKIALKHSLLPRVSTVVRKLGEKQQWATIVSLIMWNLVFRFNTFPIKNYITFNSAIEDSLIFNHCLDLVFLALIEYMIDHESLLYNIDIAPTTSIAQHCRTTVVGITASVSRRQSHTQLQTQPLPLSLSLPVQWR